MRRGADLSADEQLLLVYDAIVAYADAVASGNTTDAFDARRRLIQIANDVRPRGKVCGHQNEDYPALRCQRRPHTKGEHTDPRNGAVW